MKFKYTKWLGLVFSLLTFSCKSQPKIEKAANKNTLLWEISGNGLKEPSYFFGTIHIICADNASLSENMQVVLDRSKQIYFEIDMDDMMQMISGMSAMGMKDGKKLQDLLTPEQYDRVKKYFEKSGSPLPFSMLEGYKPMLLSSMIMEEAMECEKMDGMEMRIMGEASKRKLEIKGLETMAFQAGIFDSIPYELQAKELVDAIDSLGKQKNVTDSLMDGYKQQDLSLIEKMTKEEEGVASKYLDLLLYKRNRNWVKQFDGIAKEKSTLFAVGAGHLPGDQGVLELLRKKGYTVSPLKN